MLVRLSAAVAALALSVPLAAPVRAAEYALFVYETPADFQARTDPAKSGPYWAGYDALAKALAAAGVVRGGAPLQAPETGEAVRVRSGATARTPLDARVEQLSGWFLIEAPDANAAAAWAAKVPAASTARVEVRPVLPVTMSPR